MSSQEPENCAHCECDSGEGASLLDKFREKTEALENFMTALPLTEDPDTNRGFLIESLHMAQHIFGYLPEEIQVYVANKLHIHLTEVYAVISFYTYFTDKPVGKYRFSVCTGTACYVRGSEQILDEFKRYLDVGVGHASADLKYSLGTLRCVGACSLAPVVMMNEQVHGNVTSRKVPNIIEDCKHSDEKEQDS